MNSFMVGPVQNVVKLNLLSSPHLIGHNIIDVWGCTLTVLDMIVIPNKTIDQIASIFILDFDIVVNPLTPLG